MKSSGLPAGAAGLTDLQVVLSAWHSATERLQKTHEVLCGEVRRLTHELEAIRGEQTRFAEDAAPLVKRMAASSEVAMARAEHGWMRLPP